MQSQPTPRLRRVNSRPSGSAILRALRLSIEALERRELLSGERLGFETRVAPPDQAAAFAQSLAPLAAPTVAVHDDSSFAIAYTSHNEAELGDEVYLRRFDSDRSPALTNDLVAVDNDGTGDQNSAVAAPLPDGGVVVAWYDRGCSTNLDEACVAPFDGTDAIYARRFDGDGEPVESSPWQVNVDLAGAQTQVTVATDDHGNIALAWVGSDSDGQAGVWVRRYNAEGEAIDAADVRVFAGAGVTESPAVAIDEDGDLAIAWSVANPNDGTHEIRGQYFAAGSEEGAALAIAAEPGLNSRWPSLAMSADGGFVVAFTQDEFVAGSVISSDVYARRFAPGGDPIDSAPFLVNTSVTGDQHFGRVAVAPDGSFIVAWSGSGDQPGQEDASGVYLQAYDQLGEPVGGETLVNSTLAGDQFAPSVGLSAIGDAVVTWSGYGNQHEDESGDQSDDEGVFFQQVDFIAPRGEIDVRGKGVSIVDGDADPSEEDGTSLGNAVIHEGTLTQTFVVHNIGMGRLWFLENPGIQVVGGEPGEFSVEFDPVANIGPQSSLSFTLSFSPAATGLRQATVVIRTDDGDESPFEFSVQGIGLEAARPWQNPNNPYDVNGDGVVTGLDALIIINHLNKYGPHELAPPAEGDSPPPYLDVNGDNRVTPLDALMTINLLNSRRPPLASPQQSTPLQNQIAPPFNPASNGSDRRRSGDSKRSQRSAAPADAVFANWSDANRDSVFARKSSRRLFG